LPQQSLADALRAIGRQTAMNILFEPETVEDHTAPAVRGMLSAEAAIERVLAGTKLVVERTAANSILIAPAQANVAKPSASTRETAQNLHFAQSAAEQRDEQRSPQAEEGSPSAAPYSAPTTLAIPDILVVGSRILNADIQRTEDDAQPYVVFTRADVERSGARNVEDFLARRLTASTSSRTASQDGDDVFGNTSNIDLRGLGADETLILVDGRRMAGFAVAGTPAQPDINGIPLAAIERIEVLPATASGIYGGGATGGVINIVLRRDYDGINLKLTYGSTFDGGGDRSQVDLGAGFSLEDGRTSILLAASFEDANELTVKDRDFVERGRARILANNPGLLLGAQPPLGATTNISTIGVFDFTRGTIVRPNLTLDSGASLGSPMTFVPEGYAGPASDDGAGLLANAGRYNLDLADTANGARRGLIYAPTVKSAAGSVRREFTSWLDAYLEVTTSENEASFPRAVGDFFAIPFNSAGNPFRESIIVTTPLFGVDSFVQSSVKTDRAAAGAIVDLPGQWRAQADYTWSRTRFSFDQPILGLDTDRAGADIDSGMLDVFRDTSASSIDFSPYAIGLQGDDPQSQAKLDNAALRFSGPLPWALPGGATTLSAMIEYRRDSIDEQITPTPLAALEFLTPSRSQTVNSAYLELRLPFVAEGNSVPGINLLELQLAGRWDDYKTVGAAESIRRLNGVALTPVIRETNRFDSVNPTFGVRYKPLTDVMLRASYGTGFLPPNVSQLVAATPSVLSFFTGLTDPRRGNQPVVFPGGPTVVLLSGGNPDLGPEESASWSAGLVLTPRFVPGLRLSADWTRIEKTDNVGVLGLTQSTLDAELGIPGFVTRATDPATFAGFEVGPIIALDTRLRNIARTEVEAYDFSLDYKWASERFGEFMLSSAATHFVRNESQPTPLAPILDSAGTIAGLQWRGNATLSWTYANWTAAWTTRYFDSYRLYAAGQENPLILASQGSAGVPSQTYHDVFASFRFGSPTGLLSGTEIAVGVNNVFNTRPPVDLSNLALFYSWLGDPRLANYYVSLRKAF